MDRRERAELDRWLTTEPDEIPWPDEPYCDYCEQSGHTFASCPARDDDDDGAT